MFVTHGPSWLALEGGYKTKALEKGTLKVIKVMTQDNPLEDYKDKLPTLEMMNTIKVLAFDPDLPLEGAYSSSSSMQSAWERAERVVQAAGSYWESQGLLDEKITAGLDALLAPTLASAKASTRAAWEKQQSGSRKRGKGIRFEDYWECNPKEKRDATAACHATWENEKAALQTVCEEKKAAVIAAMQRWVNPLVLGVPQFVPN